MTLPSIPESRSLDQQDTEQTPLQSYQLRRNRARQYRCGTCGSRNCSCLNLVEVRRPRARLARGADALVQDSVDTETSGDHPRHMTIQATNKDMPLVHHVLIAVEKLFLSIEPGIVPPLETTLKAMHSTQPSDCLNYCFKEWTKCDKSG